MMEKLTLAPGVWTKVSEGPVTLFWATGRVRVSIGDDAPAEDHTSLLLTANGQPKAFQNNSTEGVWVQPIERAVDMQAVQIVASELFLIDSEGNVVLDAPNGGPI
jgi:hypothetical protein